MKFNAEFFLRFGLAFVFLFAAISGFINPQAWLAFVPQFIGNFIPRGFFLLGHDIIMFCLGIWLISGKKTFWAAVVSCILLAGIILTSFNYFLETFRDIGLFFAAVTLAMMHKDRK